MTTLNTVKLRECKNDLTAVGTLKSKEVTYGTTGNGDQTISVDLTLASIDDGIVNEHKMTLWAKNTSKLFKSYVTVANEYKTIDDNGSDADRIKVTGSFDMNEFYHKTAQELKTYNNIRAVFVNRLDKECKDEVGAAVECVITGIADEMKDGTLTGRKKLTLLTVGYENRISELQNIFVEKEMAAPFMQMYKVNTTARLYLKINNYVEIDESQESEPQEVGFGVQLSNMPDSTVRKYVNEVICIGGDRPNPAVKFTNEQIDEMKKIREMSRQEKLNSAPSTPPNSAPTGFGSGFNSNFNDSSIDSDLPF